MTDPSDPPSGPPAAVPAERMLITSGGFTTWMSAHHVALALTTYQAGRLFLISRKPDGTLRAHERRIDHCQGLWTDGQTLLASSKAILWRFENDLPRGENEADADRLFVPREGRVTGHIDIHDIATGDVGDGHIGPIFVATAFSCLGTVSDKASFRPLWRPPFVSALVPEDRCHLNGLAMDGARPAFATAVSRSDVADGWRERRRDGGVVIDIASGEIAAAGLSMPHSPRLHDGKLWLLNTGMGDFGYVDPASGKFQAVAFCPGYARGLAFVGNSAVIGLSRPRQNHTFEGLALEERLAAKDTVPRCGIIIVDLKTGVTTEWLRFERVIDELYDVAVLPGVAQAEAIGFLGSEISQRIAVDPGNP